MGGEYEFLYTTDTGVVIQRLYPIRFVATREVSRIGNLLCEIPKTFDSRLLIPDRMIQLWRKPLGSSSTLWQVYFLREWEYATDAEGEERLLIGGPDINDLLRRRVVAAYDGSDEAEISENNIDSAIAELARDMTSDIIDPTPDEGTRDWPDLSVQSSSGSGPVETRTFAFEKYLTPSGGGILGELSKSSREESNEVFFDIRPNIVSGQGITFEFRTYLNQPGRDVSDRVIFSLENGNLKNPSLRFDYTNEINYIYAGGKGREDDRELQQVADASRYSVSQWARCEGFVNAYEDTAEGVADIGRSALEDGKPVRKFLGTAEDTETTRFQRDWDIGWKVGVRYKAFEFSTIVRAVTMEGDDTGYDSVIGRLDYED